MVKQMLRVLGAAALSIVIGAGPAGAAPWYDRTPVTGAFTKSAIVVPDEENSYGGNLFDVTASGGPSWVRDSLSFFAFNGELSLSHEVLKSDAYPDGTVPCTSFGRVSFLDRTDEDERTWIEELETEGSAVVDGSIACYTGTNWGKGFEVYVVAYQGSEADPSAQCIEITRQETDGVVSYTVAPQFTPAEVLPVVGIEVSPDFECTADILHFYSEPGPDGLQEDVLGEDVSALFELTFTRSA